jgi:hypothetical protein
MRHLNIYYLLVFVQITYKIFDIIEIKLTTYYRLAQI